MAYQTTIRGERFHFADLREVFARANEEKSGDHLAGIAARSERERVAAKLVLADVGPLRDALSQNEHLVSRLEDELARVRANFGMGANGILFGVAFAAYQLFVKDVPISVNLLLNAVGIAVVTGLLLEAANWSFLAKRSAITRIAGELEEARSEGARIRQQLRDATRV